MTGAVQTARWLVVRIDDDTLRNRLAEAAGWGMPGGAHSNPWVVADFVLEVLRDVGTPATTETRPEIDPDGYHTSRTQARLVTDWTDETDTRYVRPGETGGTGSATLTDSHWGQPT